MESFRIEFGTASESFEVGQEIAGRVSWQLVDEPKEVHVRLFWYTKGKGTQDVRIVSEEVFTHPGMSGERPFSFTAPNGPYGFSGKLISLIWAIEVIALPSQESKRREFIISSDGQEVNLIQDTGIQ